MIIASDLDRTLFYSIRAIEELGLPKGTKLKPVEIKDDHWAAFVTEAAYSSLQELSRQCLFVPVTTRTTEQFKRFFIFEKEIPLTYAITANGANILYKGKFIAEWREQIKTSIKLETVPFDELLPILLREGLHVEGQRKSAENLFFYYILNAFPSDREQTAIRETAAKYGWSISLQGRKLYFIPKAISKGKALDYICQREGLTAMAGAGDSVLDWDFLQKCQYRFVPNHGELARKTETAEMDLSKNKGVLAGEEIVQHMLNLLSKPLFKPSFKNEKIETSKQ